MDLKKKAQIRPNFGISSFSPLIEKCTTAIFCKWVRVRDWPSTIFLPAIRANRPKYCTILTVFGILSELGNYK